MSDGHNSAYHGRLPRSKLSLVVCVRGAAETTFVLSHSENPGRDFYKCPYYQVRTRRSRCWQLKNFANIIAYLSADRSRV